MQASIVAAPVGSFREPSFITAAPFPYGPELNLFELAGHYWGSKNADMHSLNHTSFAWPYCEHENYDKVIRFVQNLIHMNGDPASMISRYWLILSTGWSQNFLLFFVCDQRNAEID